MATNTILPLDQLHQAIDNADTGAALTATTEQFTGGTLAPTVDAVQAQRTAALAPDVVDTGTAIYDAARRESVTGYITSSILDATQDPEFIDYDPQLNHGENARGLLREYGIPETTDNMDVMLRGGTAQDQASIASRLAKHQFDLEVLQRHGKISFAAGMVDPITLAVDLFTFGTTKALKLGRVAAAAAGATANTAVLASADAAGKEVTPLDYVVMAALSGGAYSLFGGQAANNIATGKSNWFGTLKNPNTTSAGGVTRFFSEADKVAPTPQSREVAKAVVDDPVRREDYLQNDNAPSVKRKLDNVMESHLIKYDNTVEQILKDDYGFRNIFSRRLDISGAYTSAKSKLNREVAEELLRRNDEFLKYGRVIDAQPTSVTRAADVFQEMMNKSGQIAKDYGLPGFEDFLPQPGYFHRAWSGSKIRAVETQYGKNAARDLVTQAVKRGLHGIAEEDAAVIARAVIDRAKASETGMTVDFNGLLGKKDTDALIELLKAGGLSGAALDSAVLRLESHLSERTLPKYARSRLPLDMTVAYQNADGTRLRMTDLIETDLDRIARNYTSTMNGRSALSRAGVGKDDYEINQWLQKYQASISDLPPQEFDEAVEQMRGILGDFTGNIPEANRLGPNQMRATSLANSTMLGAQGVWQANEYASMAHYFSLAETAKEFFKQFPGIKSSLKAMNGHPDLVDEVKAVLNIDLTRDVRWKPWMRQHTEFATAGNSAIDRVLHAGKQAMPFITAQKYIHQHQVNMGMNLALQRFARAMQGDADALAQIKSYGKDVDWEPLLQRVRPNVTWAGKNATGMNWGLWKQADVDTVMDTVLRYVDDAVLHGRTGQGTGFGRSAVGQILGQFRSFVALAHNKQLRGTVHNTGKLAYAQLLAFQYPLTVLMVTLNEARKGTLAIDTEEDIRALLKKSVGYTAGLGFYADAASTLGLTGGRGGLGVPLVTATQAPSKIIGGLTKQFDDDTLNDDETLHDVAQGAAMVVPVLNAVPGAAYYINSLKGD